VEGEVKKFEEPQSKEKPKPRATVPQPRPDVQQPPAVTGTATQKPQAEPATKEKPKPPADPPQPITASREKRPYESINVIMYMTVW
jgi:hypothetical protein